MFKVSPVQTSVYCDPFNPYSDKMNNIQISLGQSYNDALDARAHVNNPVLTCSVSVYGWIRQC